MCPSIPPPSPQGRDPDHPGQVRLLPPDPRHLPRGGVGELAPACPEGIGDRYARERILKRRLQEFSNRSIYLQGAAGQCMPCATPTLRGTAKAQDSDPGCSNLGLVIQLFCLPFFCAFRVPKARHNPLWPDPSIPNLSEIHALILNPTQTARGPAFPPPAGGLQPACPRTSSPRRSSPTTTWRKSSTCPGLPGITHAARCSVARGSVVEKGRAGWMLGQ